MNKSTLIRVKSEFENSHFVKELNLSKSVAFMMHVNEKVTKMQVTLKEQKNAPAINFKKIEDIIAGLDEVNALVSVCMSNIGLAEHAPALLAQGEAA